MAKTDILAAPPGRRTRRDLCWHHDLLRRLPTTGILPQSIGRHDNKRPTAPRAPATRRRGAWPHGGGHVGPWLHECVAGPARARWAGRDPTIRTGTRRITVVWVVITEAGQRALADKRPV